MNTIFAPTKIGPINNGTRDNHKEIPELGISELFVAMKEPVYLLTEAKLKEQIRKVMQTMIPKAKKWVGDLKYLGTVFTALISIPSDGMVINLIPTEYVRTLFAAIFLVGLHDFLKNFRNRPGKSAPDTQEDCEQLLIEKIREASTRTNVG